LLGIEVWNRKTDGWAPSRHAYPLLNGNNCVQFVGLDFHDSNQFFPLAMELEIKSEIDEAGVLEAFRTKRCFAKAFGASFEQKDSNWWMPALRTAELGRRSAARIYRKLAGGRR
jgi:hypothetical protein